MMSLIVPMYYGFWYFWLSPWFGAPSWFYGLLAVSFLCELLFVWFPPSGRWARLHTATAGTVFVVTFAALLMIIQSGVGGAVSRVLMASGLVAGVVAAFVVFLRRESWLFSAELVYCVLFLAAVSGAAHGL